MMNYDKQINHQYDSGNLTEKIVEGFRKAGKEMDAITMKDLAPFDEIHLGGKSATLKLAEQANLSPGTSVLDVGCGLGGPARTIAERFGCQVTGIDLTEEFCQAARLLTQKVKLDALVSFKHGNALEMPFESGQFDVVWNQHFSMNIEDKKHLYQEQNRVLKENGRLLIHEIVAGDNAPPHYPVPWARGPEISFLLSEGEMKNLLGETGFHAVQWKNISDEAAGWFQKLKAAKKPVLPPVNQKLIFEDLPEMSRNMRRNLQENRIMVIEAVLEKQ